MRARALVNRAECRLGSSDAKGAESDLQTSWELLGLTPRGPLLPGLILFRARWWEVQGKLELHRGNLPAGSEGLSQSIQFRRDLMESGASPYAVMALAKAL